MPRLQLVADLPGHSEPAWSVVFNPTKPILASSSTDKSVRLYSYTFPSSSSSSSSSSSPPAIPTINYHSTLPTSTHKRTIRSLAFSPSGSTLATGSFDSSIGIWEERVPDDVEGIEKPFGSGLDHDDEDEEDNEEKVWENVTTLDGHESEVKSIGFSADGGLLASCSRDKSVWVWEVQPDADFECIAVMLEHTQDVKCLAWHPTEEILATGSYDASILLFADDPDGDWSPFQKIQPKSTPITPPTSSSSTSTPSTTSLIQIPPLVEPETIWSLSFSPCGTYLLSGGDAGTLRIYQRSGKTMESPWIEMGCWIGHGGRATFGVSWQAVKGGGGGGGDEDKDGEGRLVVGRAVSGGGDGRIVLWEISKSEDGHIHLTILDSISSAHNLSDVNCVTFCHRTPPPDVQPTQGMKLVMEQTRKMIASCGDDGSVKVWMVVD